MENKSQEERGLEYWEKKGQSEQLLKSVCCQSTYLHKRKYIQNKLGFGNDHDVLPVFKSGGMHGAKLQRFQCVKNKTNDVTYYQAKTYVNQIYFPSLLS